MNTMFIEIDITIIIKNSEDIMAHFKFGIHYIFFFTVKLKVSSAPLSWSSCFSTGITLATTKQWVQFPGNKHSGKMYSLECNP